MQRIFLVAVVLVSFLTLGSCSTPPPDESVVYEILDKYFDEKGEEKITQAMEGIIRKKREESPDSIQKRITEPRAEIDLTNAPAQGPVDAPVTVVEYSDFLCPFHKDYVKTLKAYYKKYDGKLRRVFKFFPQGLRYEKAKVAALASLAANEQGKFWEFYEFAFQNAYNLEDSSYVKWAKAQKLDLQKFQNDMNREDFKKRIDSEAEYARKIGSPGTPSLFFNGVRLSGLQPFENLEEITDTLLVQVEERRRAGTSK